MTKHEKALITLSEQCSAAAGNKFTAVLMAVLPALVAYLKFALKK